MPFSLQDFLKSEFLSLRKRGKVKAKQLSVFTRQLSTLISAGVPLLKSLGTLEEQLEAGTLQDVTKRVALDVERGATFSEALKKYPHIFPYFYVNMIKAGELGGALDGIMKKLAQLLEKDDRLRRKVTSALMYPVFVLLVAAGVLIVLMTFIVPTFMELFSEFGGVMPLPTRVLVIVSNVFRYQWYLLVPIPFVLFLSYKFVYRLPKGRFLIDKGKLHMPILGELVTKITTARFANILGTLLSSGVPILTALDVVKETIQNEVINQAVGHVSHIIQGGGNVWSALKETGAFPPILVKMVNVGEETGALDSMLVKIAQDYEEEVDVMVNGLMALLEPILILVMGLAVGFIVVAMLLPLFTLVKFLG